MDNKVKSVPEGYHTLTPNMVIKDAAKAIDFYKQAFGAEEKLRMPGPDGKIMHAEIKIGDSIVMIAEECPEWGSLGPQGAGSPMGLMLYVEDVDAAFERAVNAGATVVMPLADMFWGDRFGKLKDPFGYPWALAEHQHDYTPEQIQKGQEAFFAQMKKD